MNCNKCGAKVARFPLKDDEGKLIVKNLFKMDLMSLLFFLVLMVLAISYKMDIEICEEIVTNPFEYCEESNACKIIEERKLGNPGFTPLFNDVDVIEIDVDDVSGWYVTRTSLRLTQRES